jgi:hypothetical protein
VYRTLAQMGARGGLSSGGYGSLPEGGCPPLGDLGQPYLGGGRYGGPLGGPSRGGGTGGASSIPMPQVRPYMLTMNGGLKETTPAIFNEN